MFIVRMVYEVFIKVHHSLDRYQDEEKYSDHSECKFPISSPLFPAICIGLVVWFIAKSRFLFSSSRCLSLLRWCFGNHCSFCHLRTSQSSITKVKCWSKSFVRRSRSIQFSHLSYCCSLFKIMCNNFMLSAWSRSNTFKRERNEISNISSNIKNRLLRRKYHRSVSWSTHTSHSTNPGRNFPWKLSSVHLLDEYF